ncbi:MAG TPA: LysE family transporter [Chryseosolibacter sp.]|nr:LysE family transporter [Chryseosolibacter sp.]
MIVLSTFLTAFSLSFLGSIPPGTLNLTALQLGLEKRTKLAVRFAFAASLIEYPYAWIAVTFEKVITSSGETERWLQLVAAFAMLLFGILNLRSVNSPKPSSLSGSGLRRGVIMGILNPLALPFWIGVTAYLKSLGFVTLKSSVEVHAYLLGVFLGAFSLLCATAYFAQRMVLYFSNDRVVKRVPGFTLIALGVYGLIDFLL